MESNPRETSAKTNGGVCGGRKQKKEHFHFFNRVLAGPTLIAFNGVLYCVLRGMVSAERGPPTTADTVPCSATLRTAHCDLLLFASDCCCGR